MSMREQMVLDEKIIGVELSNGNKKQFKWPVNDSDKKSKDHDDDDDDSTSEMSALQRSIVVHSAVLGVGAKVDQRNLVQLTIKDSSGDKTIIDQPILSLTLNKNDSISTFNLRILLTDKTEVTFKLIEGDGPVHIITSKILEPPLDFGDYSSDDNEEFDDMSGTSDEEIQYNAGDKKNQLNSTGKASKKAKKQQAGAATNSNSNNNSSSEFQQQKKKRKKDD